MKDKVLQRKMFRQKALKKYGGDMLPKFNTSGLMEGEEEQGFFDRFLFPKEEVDVNEVAGLPSLAQPYDSRKAMLLAVAGRLLQADQRPGEGMFSGVGRGVGKAITEDFPTINKIKLADRAARAKSLTGSGFKNAKKVFDKNIMDFTYATAEDISLNPKMADGTQRYVLNLKDEVVVRPKNDITFLNEDVAKNTRKTYLGKDFYKEVYSNKNLKLSDFEFGDEELGVLDQVNQDLYMNDWVPADRKYKEKFVAANSFTSLGDQALQKQIAGAKGSGFIKLLRSGTRNIVVEMDNALETLNPEYAGDGQRQRQELLNALQTRDVDKIRAVSDSTGNSIFKNVDKETLNNIVEMARKDDELNALIVDLAYLKAKTREPGGRFSVTDIDLALKTVGGGTGDGASAIRILDQAINNTLSDAYTGYITHINDNPLFDKQYGQSQRFTAKGFKGFEEMLQNPFLAPKLKEYESNIERYVRFKGGKLKSKDLEEETANNFSGGGK